jgi:hypothetical protein
MLRNTLGGGKRASLEMYFAAISMRTWRLELSETHYTPFKVIRVQTWGPESSLFGDAHGGHDRARLEEYL